MCLNVYLNREEIPKGMIYSNRNDIFFDSVVLSDKPLVRRVLQKIDEAEYSSEDYFTDRNHDINMRKDYLSTGAKTLINIIENPDICFDVCECGNNALCLLSEIHDGSIVWEVPVALGADVLSCDICFRGKHFTDFLEFQEYAKEVSLREQFHRAG